MSPASPTAAKPAPKPAEPTAAAAKVPAPVAGKAAVCGKPVTSRSGTKPCVKELDATGKHAGKCVTQIRTSVDISSIKADALAVGSFDEGERVTVLVDPSKRSEVQRRIDADVLEAWEAWKNHGRPDTLRGAMDASWTEPGKDGKSVRKTVARRYWVEPGQEKAFRELLRRAGKLHQCQVRMYPVQKHTSGRHMLPWVARDMRAVQPRTRQAKEQSARVDAQVEQRVSANTAEQTKTK